MKCQLFWRRHFSKAYHGTTVKHTLVIVILLYIVAWKRGKNGGAGQGVFFMDDHYPTGKFTVL
jgi:hypothetical protein